jgi:hypothetical protein
MNDDLTLLRQFTEENSEAAFANGHVEYWKWRGALPISDSTPANSASLQDLKRLQQTAP